MESTIEGFCFFSVRDASYAVYSGDPHMPLPVARRLWGRVGGRGMCGGGSGKGNFDSEEAPSEGGGEIVVRSVSKSLFDRERVADAQGNALSFRTIGLRGEKSIVSREDVMGPLGCIALISVGELGFCEGSDGGAVAL